MVAGLNFHFLVAAVHVIADGVDALVLGQNRKGTGIVGIGGSADLCTIVNAKHSDENITGVSTV